jgi:large subunit ribosomal protein L2
MTVVKTKPTSPGRRSMVKVVTPGLWKGRPVDALTESMKRGSGRNNLGHITTRHRGGGHKAHYRVVDFRRNKDGIPATVERLEYDPNRSAHIALLLYADGERRYILAPRGVTAGTALMSGAEAPIRAGNTLPIRNIPVGSTIHCIEMLPGKGAQLARSAGTSARLLAREGTYAQVRLRSGEIRRVHIECRATMREPLARHPPDGARHLDEPGRPPPRWPLQRRRPSGLAVGPADQGLQDAPQQAFGHDDRPAPRPQMTGE